MLHHAEDICRELWDTYGSSIENEYIYHDQLNNVNLIDEFFFVLLGGFGISYELNQSALKVLKKNGYLDSTLYNSKSLLETTIKNLKKEMEKKQFDPKTKNHEQRKYRFLETKPIIVASAGNWLWEECNWDILSAVNSCDAMSLRRWLCNCPGFGMKSSSWFLRNTGISQDCAVFDVHIIRFLSKIGIPIPERMTEDNYLSLEEILRNICNNIGIALGKLDYLLWLLGRNGFLSYVR